MPLDSDNRKADRFETQTGFAQSLVDRVSRLVSLSSSQPHSLSERIAGRIERSPLWVPNVGSLSPHMVDRFAGSIVQRYPAIAAKYEVGTMPVDEWQESDFALPPVSPAIWAGAPGDSIQEMPALPETPDRFMYEEVELPEAPAPKMEIRGAEPVERKPGVRPLSRVEELTARTASPEQPVQRSPEPGLAGPVEKAPVSPRDIARAPEIAADRTVPHQVSEPPVRVPNSPVLPPADRPKLAAPIIEAQRAYEFPVEISSPAITSPVDQPEAIADGSTSQTGIESPIDLPFPKTLPTATANSTSLQRADEGHPSAPHSSLPIRRRTSRIEEVGAAAQPTKQLETENEVGTIPLKSPPVIHSQADLSRYSAPESNTPEPGLLPSPDLPTPIAKQGPSALTASLAPVNRKTVLPAQPSVQVENHPAPPVADLSEPIQAESVQRILNEPASSQQQSFDNRPASSQTASEKAQSQPDEIGTEAARLSSEPANRSPVQPEDEALRQVLPPLPANSAPVKNAQAISAQSAQPQLSRQPVEPNQVQEAKDLPRSGPPSQVQAKRLSMVESPRPVQPERLPAAESPHPIQPERLPAAESPYPVQPEQLPAAESTSPAQSTQTSISREPLPQPAPIELNSQQRIATATPAEFIDPGGSRTPAADISPIVRRQVAGHQDSSQSFPQSESDSQSQQVLSTADGQSPVSSQMEHAAAIETPQQKAGDGISSQLPAAPHAAAHPIQPLQLQRAVDTAPTAGTTQISDKQPEAKDYPVQPGRSSRTVEDTLTHGFDLDSAAPEKESIQMGQPLPQQSMRVEATAQLPDQDSPVSHEPADQPSQPPRLQREEESQTSPQASVKSYMVDAPAQSIPPIHLQPETDAIPVFIPEEAPEAKTQPALETSPTAITPTTHLGSSDVSSETRISRQVVESRAGMQQPPAKRAGAVGIQQEARAVQAAPETNRPLGQNIVSHDRGKNQPVPLHFATGIESGNLPAETQPSERIERKYSPDQPETAQALPIDRAVDLGQDVLARSASRAHMSLTQSLPSISRRRAAPPDSSNDGQAGAYVFPFATPRVAPQIMSLRMPAQGHLQRSQLSPGQSLSKSPETESERRESTPTAAPFSPKHASTARDLPLAVPAVYRPSVQASLESASRPAVPNIPAGSLQRAIETETSSSNLGQVQCAINAADELVLSENEAEPKLNLDQLARQVLPLIKKMLAIEKERMTGRK
jgi:hypothetical protein